MPSYSDNALWGQGPAQDEAHRFGGLNMSEVESLMVCVLYADDQCYRCC